MLRENGHQKGREANGQPHGSPGKAGTESGAAAQTLDAGPVMDPVAVRINAELKTYRDQTPPVAVPKGAAAGLQKVLKPGELEAMDSTLAVVQLRPGKFTACTDGVTEVPFDVATPRKHLDAYRSRAAVHEELVATVQRAESDMRALAATLHQELAGTYEKASTAAADDVAVARALEAATAFHGAAAAARRTNNRQEKLLEANMSSAELAARRAEQSKQHADAEAAKQARRAAAAKKK